jgi:tetratricopeptide (TPR) repeat protein/pimeloyl-ACP methyl ester carboxylesterase
MSELIQISGCENYTRKADVVFVHGLGGDAHATWRYGKDNTTSWPHWLGEEFQEIGVWTLDYEASPTKSKGLSKLLGFGSKNSGHTQPLPDRAWEVLTYLIQSGLGKRPLMFICHSMGGLLVKQLLRKASDKLDEPCMQELVRHTKVVLFLATPHSGAELASFLNALRRIFRSTKSIKDLRMYDAHLRDLLDWYRGQALRLGIETRTYYETKKLKGITCIVNPSSAHPGIGSDPIPLDEDHISISRPRSRNSHVYSAASNLLKSHVLISMPDDSSISTSNTSNESTIITPSQANQLINTVQLQADTLKLLTSQQDKLLKIFPAISPYEETKYVSTEGQGYEYKLPFIQRNQQVSPILSYEGFESSRERVPFTNIDDLLEKLETTEDIAEEIKSQLSLWNNDTALSLVEKLKEHLEGINVSISKRVLDYLFLIARVYVSCAEKKDSESETHIEQAKELFDKIDKYLLASPRPELAADVFALRGSIEKIQNGEDAALVYLAGHEDPYAIRIHLAIYLRKNDLNAAIRLIDGRPAHLRWCDLGVAVYAGAGRREKAKELVDWAYEQDKKNKYPQCIVFLADASLFRALANQDPGKNILPKNLSENERGALRQVLTDIEPVLSCIITRGSIDSELATHAVKISWQAHYLLGHREEVAKLVRLMSTRNPVLTDVARSVMSGFITPPPDLAQRLRNDYPDDLNANILAAVIESKMGQSNTAFDSARKLLVLADTNEKKEELFKLFQHLAQALDGDTFEECGRIARPLVEHNPQLQAMFDANQFLRTGKVGMALEVLDRHQAEDDVFWLQLRGEALRLNGCLPEAVEMFRLASLQTGAPELLHQAADLAFQAEKVVDAVKLYEELIAAQPDNHIARSSLAFLYAFNLHDIGNAAIHYNALHDAEPENQIYTVNLAVCFAQLYRPHESLVLYDEACKVEQPDIRAVLGRSELYLSLGKPDEACDSIKHFRDCFWDSPDFLLACMNTAYAAGDEDFAHAALSKLNELRVANKVDENSFRLVQTDEVIEMFKESFKASEDRKKDIHMEMLKGQMPWVLAAQAVGDAVYWSWRLRTQELKWIYDDQINRASYTIYSTNGFHVGQMDDGKRVLLPLECPVLGTTIVADLSALITLHRLDLLDKAADYFGEILVPEQYLATVLEDGKKMVFHQRSKQRTADEINRYVANEVITIEQNGRNDPHYIVDEYNETGGHRYHLIDVITPIYEVGLVDELTYERVRKVCLKPSSVDGEHPPIGHFQSVHIELLSLETLTLFGLLDQIAKFYHVYITDEARIEIRQRLDLLRLQDETRGWHFDLWNRIRDDKRFKFVRQCVPQGMKTNSVDDKNVIAFLTSFMAQDQRLPLLADDRVCQAMTLNLQQNAPYGSFGSDAVVHALLKSERLNDTEAAEAILTLMRWRYRFIVPTVQILNTYKAQYFKNPPGLPLQYVAEYVHDCMRDTGLFGGLENTDFTQSMSMQLYTSWLQLLAKWIVDLWAGDEISKDTATSLTNWCVQEFLPSQPRVVPGAVKGRMGALVGRILITHILLNFNSIDHNEQLSDALMAVKSAMKLSDEVYLLIITEILNDTRRTDSES